MYLFRFSSLSLLRQSLNLCFNFWILWTFISWRFGSFRSIQGCKAFTLQHFFLIFLHIHRIHHKLLNQFQTSHKRWSKDLPCLWKAKSYFKRLDWMDKVSFPAYRMQKFLIPRKNVNSMSIREYQQFFQINESSNHHPFLWEKFKQSPNAPFSKKNPPDLDGVVQCMFRHSHKDSIFST